MVVTAKGIPEAATEFPTLTWYPAGMSLEVSNNEVYFCQKVFFHQKKLFFQSIFFIKNEFFYQKWNFFTKN